jgi:2-dehydro-3-deoxygluconokinase
MDHIAEEGPRPQTANGSGSGAGVRRRRRGERTDAAPDESRETPTSTSSEARAVPLVVIDPEEPAPGEERRALRPLLLPSQPNEAAEVERWERPRDLVSLGECLVEMTRRPDGPYQPSIAGDVFNTLFYASRLGLRCGLVTAVGDDLFTPMLIERIDDEGIDLAHVQRLAARRNGLYFIEHDAWGERAFHYWRDNSAATETLLHADIARTAAYIHDTHFLLITGVSLAVMKSPERLRDLLERVDGRTTIVLDGNYRPRLWKGALEYQFRIETILPFVDVFLPSREDLELAWRGRDVIEPLRDAAEAGVRTIIMKDAARGCSILVDGELVSIAPLEGVHVVDTTGAGDAFDAGVIAGLLRGASLEESCELGQRVAMRALMVPGAIDPAFSPHAIDASWRVG